MFGPKYIVINDGGLEVAIVFDNILVHRNVAGARNVVGAGFYSIKDGKVDAFGESITLGIKSRPEDSRIIERAIFGNEY